jgi:hypothetical protein
MRLRMVSRILFSSPEISARYAAVDEASRCITEAPELIPL